VFNATVVPRSFLGFSTMWPQGQTQPLAATLNAYDGAITNNMAIVPSTTGAVSVFPSAPTHLVLDIFGYFAPCLRVIRPSGFRPFSEGFPKRYATR
jgi:hypothetical protein